MNAEQRLALTSAKIQRARAHIGDLEREVVAFLASRPFPVARKENPATGKYGWAIDAVSEVPTRIRCICGDAIQNLRSALDHLANQLLLVRVGASATDEEFNFPIHGDAKRHQAFFTRMERPRIRADALRALRSLEAYKGGAGHQFWVLNRLNNIDKHRLLLAVGSASRSINLGGIMSRQMRRSLADLPENNPLRGLASMPVLDAFFRPADRQCPLKVGDVLLEGFGEEDEVDPSLDFRFDVALSEPEVATGTPVLDLLSQFHHLVESTVKKFEAHLE